MRNFTYIDLLAFLEIEDAHPGGFELTKRLFNNLPLSSESKILEVGCGSGKTASYLYHLYKSDITAIDINRKMLRKAMQRFKHEQVPIKLHAASAENLPFSNNSFDVIISESVTSFTNVKKSLNEYSRVLNDNGFILAIEMTTERLLLEDEQNEIESVYGIKQTYTENEWISFIKNAGFKNIKVIAGNTISNVPSSSSSSPSFQQLPSSILSMYYKHQEILFRFGYILGYRVFLCHK
ncbi:methyltransferase domain-containing protein [Bacillus sp. RG28]|uniref:Methyltransferase domain-containing protein n=1 Tax=Gottfriedia endophytica TaxID=2820819 RepID=A0A940NTQ6_9BACI|nr:class I SAM-dependent methyltransferase [Gottfriedia endophytica]MBP0727358.1 methyltransferase domain-containing protein [Gottfriedia endophytica]